VPKLTRHVHIHQFFLHFISWSTSFTYCARFDTFAKSRMNFARGLDEPEALCVGYMVPKHLLARRWQKSSIYAQLLPLISSVRGPDRINDQFNGVSFFSFISSFFNKSKIPLRWDYFVYALMWSVNPWPILLVCTNWVAGMQFALN
jgi:hypothetical protein